MDEITNPTNTEITAREEKMRHSMKMNERLQAADFESPTEIREEIRRTQYEMDDTLTQIKTRLEMEELATDAFESVKRAFREKQPDVFGAIRRNPGPTALAALGLGWMMIRGTGDGELEERLKQRLGEKTTNLGHAIGGKAAHVKERIGEKASHVKDRIGQKAEEARLNAGQKGSEIGGKAHEMIGDVKGKTSSALHGSVETTRHAAHRVTEGFHESLETNPLALGALAIAVGAACGLAVPLSRREEQAINKISEGVDKLESKISSELGSHPEPSTSIEQDVGWSGDYEGI